MQIGAVNSVSQSQKPSFGAHIPKRLKDELFYEAYTKGTEACDAFVKKAKKVEHWGQETCTISKVETKTRDGSEYSLDLVDSYDAPFRRAALPKKPTLLETFMSLTEKNIVDAESKLMY